MMPNLKPIKEWSNNVNKNPAPAEIVEDILFDTPEINAVVGRSEIGKTNFCNQIAHCLANQVDFIGQKVVSPQTVAYIGFEVEEHQFNIRNTILEKHIPASPLLWVDTSAPFFKLNSYNQAAFQDAISFAKVVIIDPVRYIVPGNYIEPAIVSQFMQRLQEVMRANNQLAIVVLYFKKLDSRSPQEPGDLWNIKGATEWGDMCSTVLMLERAKQGHKPSGGFAPVSKDDVTLHFAKTRNAARIHDPINIRWNRQECLFEKV